MLTTKKEASFLVHICYAVVLSQTRILFFVSDPTEGNYSVQRRCHAAVAGREWFISWTWRGFWMWRNTGYQLSLTIFYPQSFGFFFGKSKACLPSVPVVFSHVRQTASSVDMSSPEYRRHEKTFRAGHFLRLNRNRKPRIKSLWHPGHFCFRCLWNGFLS